jgi:tyrosyl-tRNA synthetase
MKTISLDPGIVESTIAQAEAVFADNDSEPRQRQKAMALLVTAQVHGPEAAVAAQVAAAQIAAGRDTASVEVTELPLGDCTFPVSLAWLVYRSGVCGSTSQAMKLIEGGGVRLDGRKLTSPATAFGSPGLLIGKLLSVGKKTFRRLAA